MNYNEKNHNNGDNKFTKIFGFLFLIAGLIVLKSTIDSYYSWNSKKANYNKEYVYSENRNLYYEKEQDNIYVKKIYNNDNEIISLDIPNKETVVMYCSKKNNTECIYFENDNELDQNIQSPILGLFAVLFLISIAIFLIQPNDRKESSISNIYLFYVTLFLAGICFIGCQLYNTINYFNLKNDNNIAIATIYSEIYNIDKSDDNYKLVAYYYVNNQKYIYVNDSYEKGNLEENLGKTFELYYDKNNPNIVSKKKNPVNLLILFIGILFSVFTFPFVFFKKKMEKRINKAISLQKNNE